MNTLELVFLACVAGIVHARFGWLILGAVVFFEMQK